MTRSPGWRGALEDHDHILDADLLADRRCHHRPGGCRGGSPDCDLFAGLRRIGIDEIAYKRGHKYIVIVVNHDTGMLIWAASGRGTKTVHAFFDSLGDERCKLLTHLFADGAD